MRSTSLPAVSSSCLIVFASPDSAGGGLGRFRAVSGRGVLFSHFGKNMLRFLSDRIYGTATYHSTASYH